jgi:hypothetical protein
MQVACSRPPKTCAERRSTQFRARALAAVERRIGEVMAELRAAGKLAKGAKGNPKGRGAKIVRVADGPAHPTLADQCVDKRPALGQVRAPGFVRAPARPAEQVIEPFGLNAGASAANVRL